VIFDDYILVRMRNMLKDVTVMQKVDLSSQNL